MRKDFKSALVAFEAARALGLATYALQKRLAGSMMRVEQRKAGEDLYRALIKEYPDARGLKMSYVDSLLSCRDFSGALQVLREFGFSVDVRAWVAHQFGRCYLGLHRYQDAVRAFELPLSHEHSALAYHMIARAYHRLGDRRRVAETLETGLARSLP